MSSTSASFTQALRKHFKFEMYLAVGDNSDTNNNSGSSRGGLESSLVVETTNSVRSSRSSVSVMVEGGLKWKTIVVPGGTTPSSAVPLPRPRRDFHFKRIEVEETPKWFVWPKRNRASKSLTKDKKVNDDESSTSSGNNFISRPDMLTSKNSSTAITMVPRNNAEDLRNSNNNSQQNLIGQPNLSDMASIQSGQDNLVQQSGQSGKMLQFSDTVPALRGNQCGSSAVSSPLDIKGARQQWQREVHYRTLTNAATAGELINISNSEPSSYIMHCRIATSVDSEHRISGSAPATSQTFKILSISKKTLENGEDDDLDLTNYVISNCRQLHSQPTVLLSRPTTAGDTVKEVH
uniref:Uncharacterized protein n=1 Tax=Setaria digitata TaxID=48799 RepID=A0A915PPT0_9BILA